MNHVNLHRGQRIIDNLPRLIDAEFIRPLANVMQDALITELDISSEKGRGRGEAFLAENAMTSSQREDLLQKRKRLATAREAIRRFGTE